jgi:hypothetical protein
MDRDHLSVVEPGSTHGVDGGNDDGDSESTGRQPARLRPKRALPTERLKLDTQHAALRAFVSASHRGVFGVGSADVATRLGISPDTAGLVNNFFVEAGFLMKESRGKYKPVPAVNEYARLYSLDPDAAVKELAKVLRGSWYFGAVTPELELGPVSEEVLVNVIGKAAGVGGDRLPQLQMVLEWLRSAGLIVANGDGTFRLPSQTATETAPDPNPDEAMQEPNEEPPTGPAGTKSQEPTIIVGADPPTVISNVLAFKFEFSLTAEDLRKMTPDQIAATFEAVGKVIAIKAEAGID